MHDLIIVGGGPAGLCAGIYAARRGLKTLILEKGVAGGQLALAAEIGNYPGFESISGVELAKKMEEHAKALGVEFNLSEVLRIEEDGEEKKVSTSDKAYNAKAVILATGAVHRKLEAPGEEAPRGGIQEADLVLLIQDDDRVCELLDEGAEIALGL